MTGKEGIVMKGDQSQSGNLELVYSTTFVLPSSQGGDGRSVISSISNGLVTPTKTSRLEIPRNKGFFF